MQLFMLFLGWIIGRSIIQIRGKGLVVMVLIFQLFCVFLKVYINKSFYGDFVGPNAIDAIDYRDCGESSGYLNYSTFFLKVLQNGEDYDDWGFLSIIWFCYNSFGASGYWALLFVNIFVIVLTSSRLYKLSNHFLDKRITLLLVALWSIMPFAVETSTGFLKENFFSLVVVSTFLHLYRYIDRRSIHNLILAIMWGVATSFFRMALGYAIILSIISLVFINSRFLKKHLLLVSILLLVPLVVIVPLVITFLLSKRGITMDALLYVRTEGIVGIIVDYVAGLLGPFPKFIGDSQTVQYMTFSSFSALVKTLISPFFWLELISILRNGKTRYLPMVIFILCNLFMLVISHYAIQLRFQWPHMCIFFILAAIGFNEFIGNKRIRNIYYVYVFFVFLIIYKYNFGV